MELNYQQFGKGKPLIILHGLFGMSDNWITLAKKLSENYSVYVLDQRNHGRSGHHQVFNYEAMVEDLMEFIENHQLPPVYLLGHSMGGKTAMQFAFDYPDRLSKLIVADMSPDAYNHKHDKLIEAMLEVDLERFGSRSEIQEALSKKIPDIRIRQFLLKNLYWKDRSSLGWKANLSVINENLPEVFKALDNPVPFEKPSLFLRGSESNYITEKHIPRIRKLFPDAQIKTIEGASHWLHAEKPKEFLDSVIQFLQNKK
ncbi:MAG: alpha/beta fold hydrolase [Bacteroidota bacterium]